MAAAQGRPPGRHTRCPSPRSPWPPSWASPGRPPGAGCTTTSAPASRPRSRIPTGAPRRCRSSPSGASPPTPTPRSARPRSGPSSPPGRRTPPPSPPPSTPSRARRWRSAPAAGWDDPLSPVLEASAVERDSLRRHAGRGRRLARRLPPLPGGQGPAARQGPVRLLGPVRPRRRRPPRVLARRHGHGRAGLRRATATTWSGWPSRALGRALGRRGTPRREGRRRPSACTWATAPAASS